MKWLEYVSKYDRLRNSRTSGTPSQMNEGDQELMFAATVGYAGILGVGKHLPPKIKTCRIYIQSYILI
jgi:hypothetical protein